MNGGLFMIFRLLIINLFFMQVLVACGGGGGDSKSTDSENAGAGVASDNDDFSGDRTVGQLSVAPNEVENSVCFSDIPSFREINDSYFNKSITPPVQDYSFDYLSDSGEFGSTSVEISFVGQNQEVYDTLTELLFNVKQVNPTTRAPELSISNEKPVYSLIRGFCRDIQCVADSVFGEGWGLRFLFKEKFGLVLSGYVDPNTDEFPDDQYLYSVATAALSLPKGTFPLDKSKYAPATREFAPNNIIIAPFKRGYAPSENSVNAAAVMMSSRTGATETTSMVSNADIYLLDPWVDNRDFHSRVSTVFHELIHVMDQVKENQIVLSMTDDWLKISDWKRDQRTNQWLMGKPQTKCSEYGSTLPQEDFAECGTMYRFAPNKLKKISKAKYNFFKKRVFQNTEYNLASSCKNKVESF